ncbi:MAG: cytidylate kinase, partial [Actinobacteria bacterium]|nr:cytidylate kinase [Actinomycetota bacterium]
MSPIIIAIDGPAGSGKSSVSKQVARELKFGYLDTGAAYRALAWACLNLPDFNVASLEARDLAKDFNYSISTDPDDFWVKLDSHDLTQAIRETSVAEFVSQVAGIPRVRDFM